MKTIWRALASLAVAVTLTAPTGVGAQSTAADPADVSTLDGVIEALYAVISGPAGEARDWDRFHTLFIPEGARLVPSGRGPEGQPTHQVWTPEEYAERAGPQLESGGFFEREIGRVTEEFGNVVHVFSAYDSKRTLADPEPFARGINSIQLFHDGSRYWIVTIFWDSERPGNPIPARYLGG
jgi:hypothetical protein